MFGTLKPSLCSLPSKERQAYRRAYCGTCKALGSHYGQLARPLLSYDMVFIAALIESTRAKESQTGRCRCPLLPVVQKDIISPESPSMRVAAATQVILASAWFDDQVRDGNPAYRPARGMTHPKAERAYKQLSNLGLDLSCARDMAAKQSALEATTRNVRTLASPTAEVLVAVLEAIPNLPNSIEMDDKDRTSLRELGNALGLAIYAVDALEDLEDDTRGGQFNPCLDTVGRIDIAAVQEVSETLSEAIRRMTDALSIIPVVRGKAGLRAATRGLAKRARRAIEHAETKRDQWCQLRRQSIPMRWIRALGTIALWLPLWCFRGGRRVVKNARRRITEPVEASVCAHQSAFALAVGSARGSGLGGSPNHSIGRGGDRKKKGDDSTSQGSCNCCDCCDCCDCCCCLSVCGD